MRTPPKIAQDQIQLIISLSFVTIVPCFYKYIYIIITVIIMFLFDLLEKTLGLLQVIQKEK